MPLATTTSLHNLTDATFRSRPRAQTLPPFTALYWDFLARHERLLACDQQMTMQPRYLSRKSAADVRGSRWQADDLRGQPS
jgi:deoxyribodipyrimidine photolyase-related protein